MDIVTIKKEPIELYKLLKLSNLVGSGGEAKLVVSEGFVRLNGVVETRKRKKVLAGDVVTFNDKSIKVRLAGDDNEG